MKKRGNNISSKNISEPTSKNKIKKQKEDTINDSCKSINRVDDINIFNFDDFINNINKKIYGDSRKNNLQKRTINNVSLNHHDSSQISCNFDDSCQQSLQSRQSCKMEQEINNNNTKKNNNEKTNDTFYDNNKYQHIINKISDKKISKEIENDNIGYINIEINSNIRNINFPNKMMFKITTSKYLLKEKNIKYEKIIKKNFKNNFEKLIDLFKFDNDYDYIKIYDDYYFNGNIEFAKYKIDYFCKEINNSKDEDINYDLCLVKKSHKHQLYAINKNIFDMNIWNIIFNYFYDIKYELKTSLSIDRDDIDNVVINKDMIIISKLNNIKIYDKFQLTHKYTFALPLISKSIDTQTYCLEDHYKNYACCSETDIYIYTYYENDSLLHKINLDTGYSNTFNIAYILY
jgi:hypothetical protein